MRLHLGCGQQHLDGYTNIDFPPAEHTVQDGGSKADEFADITQLRYPANSIDEVRLHHTYEHFPRPVAAALMASWHSWLRPRGRIHIEVPDFRRTAIWAILPFTGSHRSGVALRHIFGSNEAPWATHYEGWTSGRLSRLLKLMQFGPIEIRRNSWQGTHNFEIIAERSQQPLLRDDAEQRIAAYLREFLVDDSEADLLSVWMRIARQQLDATWAT